MVLLNFVEAPRLSQIDRSLWFFSTGPQRTNLSLQTGLRSNGGWRYILPDCPRSNCRQLIQSGRKIFIRYTRLGAYYPTVLWENLTVLKQLMWHLCRYCQTNFFLALSLTFHSSSHFHPPNPEVLSNSASGLDGWKYRTLPQGWNLPRTRFFSLIINF